MTKRRLPLALLTALVFLAVSFCAGDAAWAQPPMGPPGSGGGGEMPWQVAAMFTANWVLAAVAVTILQRPSKRPDKPKKTFDEETE
jgi:hypothetical protein